MRVDKDLGITIAIVLIFIWLTAISFAIVDLYAYRTFVLGELGDIHEMFADVYHYITNLLNMGVVL